MRRFKSILLTAPILLLAACASPGPSAPAVQRLSPEELARLAPTPNPTVSLEEIMARSKVGTAPEALIKRLADTGTIHVLTPAQIVELSRQGVDQKVIDYLVHAQEKARQATLITQLADRDAQAAAQLARERERRRALQMQQDSWHWGFGYGPWGPSYGIGWGRGYYYDPFYRGYRPRW